LNGAEIVVDREYAAPLKDGEHYIEDLKGLAVVSACGQTLGHIADVLEGGGGQLAEVTLASGERRLAPYRKEFFGEADFACGTIVLLEPWVLDTV
jgi:16S rRNA processing protein RimM